MEFEYSAGFIVVHGDRFLLLFFGDRTDTPKGNIEKGETAYDAALRELKEEAGIEKIKVVPGFKERETYFYRKDGKTVKKTVVYFLGVVEDEKVKLSGEHDRYEWVTYAEAMRKIKYKSMRALFEKVHEFMKKNGSLV